jgi:hypothetical protein
MLTAGFTELIFTEFTFARQHFAKFYIEFHGSPASVSVADTTSQTNGWMDGWMDGWMLSLQNSLFYFPLVNNTCKFVSICARLCVTPSMMCQLLHCVTHKQDSNHIRGRTTRTPASRSVAAYGRMRKTGNTGTECNSRSLCGTARDSLHSYLLLHVQHGTTSFSDVFYTMVPCWRRCANFYVANVQRSRDSSVSTVTISRPERTGNWQQQNCLLAPTRPGCHVPRQGVNTVLSQHSGRELQLTGLGWYRR